MSKSIVCINVFIIINKIFPGIIRRVYVYDINLAFMRFFKQFQAM